MSYLQLVIALIIVLISSTNSDVLRMSKEEKDFHIDRETTDNQGSYVISDAEGYGRTFDGIGAVSGGGATSRLLVNYAEPYRSQILDYLFKPNFAASLHILKVEIGGDAQSTDGSEPSHMHTPDDLNFTRGYEWWLMKEAKKRNPAIKLIGLPWAWPAWIAEGYRWPYQNVDLATKYIINWIKGAKSEHNLDIDYVGIWNEKLFTVKYIIALRKALNEAGLNTVKIIAADEATFGPIANAGSKIKELYDSVDVYGVHYPGTNDIALAKNSGKPLWSSEDYSTFDDNVGAGCWARILNQNYVNGEMTATIAWNLVASYYDNLPFNRTAILTANEPWSGHYEVVNSVWITAHTTQFTKPGWTYLKSVGHLNGGGSYVSMTDKNGELTIIIETMSHDMAICIRPPLPPYTVKSQTAIFGLQGSFKSLKKLNMWQTILSKSSSFDSVFENKGVVEIDANGVFNISLGAHAVITLSTLSTGNKGIYPTPPPSGQFPYPYKDNFDGPNDFSEPHNFADQSGVFEYYYNASSKDGHQRTMRQVVPEKPISWCDDSDVPITVVGDYGWKNVKVSVDMKIETANGVFVAARVDRGGCEARGALGAFFWVFHDSWVFSTDINRASVHKRCNYGWANCWSNKFLSTYDDWHSISIAITHSDVVGVIDGVQVFSIDIDKLDTLPKSGWAALGTSTFGYAQFDNFMVQ